MNRFFAVIGGLLILVLAALFVVPSMIDWSRYHGVFEDEATRLLGRPVRLGEHVRLRLLPTPYIFFDNIRVADTSGHFDTPLLRADALRVQLAIGPLLTGSLAAQDIELTAPSLRLATDENGHGNWLGLGAAAGEAIKGRLESLALNTVHIDHGNLELTGAAGWHYSFDDVTGDLDAPALAGPFHFKGQIANEGKPTEVRFTASRETSGKTRINALWHDAAQSAASYTLDGFLDGLDSNPKLTGTLQAQLPATQLAPALEAKTAIEATADTAVLSDIDLVFDGGGRPQRITGKAKLNLRDHSASDAELSAIWLDLDKIAGTDPGRGPLATLQRLAERLPTAEPAEAEAKISIKIGEAILGSGSVNDLAIAGHGTAQGFAIDSLSARLPGLSRLDAAGMLSTRGVQFDGQARLWGKNIGALVNWVVPGAGVSEGSSASSYLVDGTFTISKDHFRAEPLRAEVSGTTVAGAVSYSSAGPRLLSVSLDSGKLDLAKLLDVPFTSAALSSLLTPESSSEKTSGGPPPSNLATLLSGDTHLDLRIGHLITAQGTLSDVSAKLDRSDGRLDIPGIDLTADGGASMHTEGALQSKAGTAEGQFRLTLAAPDAKSLAEALKFAGAGELPAAAEAGLSAITPLAPAGTIQIGGSGPEGARLRLDGLANGSRVSAAITRDDTGGDMLGSRIDVSAAVVNPDEGRLLGQIAQALGLKAAAPAGAGAAPGPGTASLRLSGVPKTGVITSAALDTQALHSRFDGRASLEDTNWIAVDGTLGLDAPAAPALFSLLRLDKILPAADGPLKLQGRLKREAGVFTLAEGRAVLANDTLTGQMSLDLRGARPKIAANLNSSIIRLDRLTSILLQARPPDSAAATKPVVAPYWSSLPLDLGALAGFDAHIDLKTAELSLADAAELTDATGSLDSHPDALDLTLDQGHLARGLVSGHAHLAKDPGGLALTLDTQVTGAHLDALSAGPTGLPRPQGQFGATVKIEAHGTTPVSLAASATGSGEFSLTEGGIAAMSPLAIDAVARQMLTPPAPAINTSEVSQRLDKARLLAPFPMLGAHGALTISDGAVHFDRLKVQSSKADLEVASRLDLVAMRLSTTFNLAPKSPQADKPAPPAVPFLFEGQLLSFASAAPSIDSAALTRDLSSRKQLSAPEQTIGLWPATTVPPASPAPPADSAGAPVATATAPLPAERGGVGPTDAAVIGASPDTATAVGSGVAVLPAAGSEGSPQAAPAPATDTSLKRPVHAKKKNLDWAAALLQNLFGN